MKNILKINLLRLFLLFSLISMSGININAQNQSQFEVLEQFYNTTFGDSWINNAGWLDQGIEVCDWYGITCNGSGEIIRIELAGNNLGGGIPFSLGELDKLKVLDLKNNNIDNIYPAENIYTLIPNIELMDFTSNDIKYSGTLSPTFIEMYCDADVLILDNNPCFCVSHDQSEICSSTNSVFCQGLNFTIDGNGSTFLGGFNSIGDTVILDAFNGGNYTWSNGAVGQSIEYIIESSFSYVEVYSSNNGCIDTFRRSIIAVDALGFGQINEGKLLEILYDAFDGDNWTNTINNQDVWFSTNDYCDWYGIECNSNGDIIELNLQNNNLSGDAELTVFLLFFSQMQSVDLSYNNIVGCVHDNYCLEASFPLDMTYNCDMSYEGNVPYYCENPFVEFFGCPNPDQNGIRKETLGCNNQFRCYVPGGYDLLWSNGSTDDEIIITVNQPTTISVTTACGRVFSKTIEPQIITPALSDLTLIYNSLDGDNWTNKVGPQGVAWLEGCNACDWYGITCDNNNRVIGLDLSNNNLSGSLTSSMFDLLTKLDSLDLSNNSLFGAVEIDFSPTSLSFLDLSHNQITGSYPLMMNQMSIEYLDLSNNLLDGEVDFSLFPDGLVHLDLSDNDYSGELGAPLGDVEFSKLDYLNLTNNSFEGCYPANYASLCLLVDGILPFGGNECLWLQGDFGEWCTDMNCNFFVFAGDTEICVGDTTSLSVSGPSAVEWNTGENVFEITVFPTETTTYYVTDQCGRMDSVTVEVYPVYDFYYTDTICAYDSVVFGGIIYDETGDYVQNYLSINGCDSVENLSLFVFPLTPDETELATICDNEFYEFEGMIYEEEGSYPVTVQDGNGCDYVRTLELTVLPLPDEYQYHEICWNEDVEVYDEIYNSSGTFFDTIPNPDGGCDIAVVIEVLQFPKTPDETESATICDNESYTFEGMIYEEAGTYPVIVQDGNGCDYTRTLELTVLPLPDDYQYHEICWNEDVEVYGELYDSSGTFYDTIPNPDGGCDIAVVIEVLQFPQTPDETELATICDNEFYEFEGMIYEEAGTYPVIVQDGNGCEYTRTLELIVLPLPDDYQYHEICWNEDVEVYGELYNSSGTFYDTIPNPDGGCDIAVVIEVLQFAKTPDETESATICDNEFYEFEGMIYEEEGSYPVTVQDGNGCDYVRTLILGVSPNPTIENDYLICPGDSIVVHDMVYYEGGNYIDTIENEPLCDSIIFTNITVLSGDQLSIDTTICVGDTIFGYYEEGIYEFVIDQGECFTEITLTLSVEDYPMAFFEFDLCTGDEIEFLGQVYDQGGIFQYSVETDFICDSVYIIEIIEFPVDTVNLDISICSNEDFMGYTESGTYLYSVDEGGDCPTQYILELTVDDLINLALSDIICEGDSIEVRGNYYSEEGTYYDTLASITSCDTLLTFQLAIYEPTAEVFEEATICANQTYEFYGQQFDEAGSYELEVIDENGCVFIANLTLGVDDLNALVFNESICWNETVVIRGVEYSEDYEGEEIVESLDGGCDTIISITVTQFIKTDDEIEEANICANDDYTFEGTTYQEAGIYEVEKEDVNGCSYTRTLILGVDPNPFREETILICEGESYEIGDSTYIESGIYSTFLGNELGCDSLISTDLTVIESTSITIDSTICQGASVYGYTESGSYDFTIDNGECQQEISLELQVETIPRIDYEEVICIGDSVEILGQFYYADYYEEQAIAGDICDTILTISVTQIGQITSIDTVLCAGEDIYNQTETGDYEIVDSLAGGCFDLIYLSLVIEDSPVVMQVDTICQGDSILWDGAYIYEAGTYSYVVEVDGSCDTMRVLELTDIEDLPSVLDTTICAGDTFHGVGETDTFNYLIEYGNCDKEITVFLEVLPPLSSEMAASICDGDTLFVGADQLTMTGVYETVLVSDAGCDSLVKTFLAVLPRDTLAESVTICEGEEYNGYSMTGQYSYFQEGSGLCDDLVNLTLEVNQVSSGSDVLFVCPGDSVLINGEYETEAGFFIDSLIGENGCDSLLFIELIDVETSAVFIDTTICFGEDYEGFTVSGTYQYEIQISDDCIVNIELELTVEDEIGSYQYIEICEGDSVVINGNVYTEELEVIENYDIDGLCDSTVVYDINFAEILTVSLDTIICDGEEVYGFMESGIYEVEVQAQNCLLLVSLELLVVDTVFVESGTFVQSSCGSASGSVDVEFNVDFQGAVYSIDEGLTYQDTSFYDGLAAGDYEMVIIFPGFPCLTEIYYPFTIGATSDLVVDTLVFNTVLCDMEQGVVELEAVTGQGPYDYVWSDGVQDSIRTDLGVGEYSVEITDAAGCSASLSFEVVQGEEIDIDFQGQNSYEICFGDSILLAANNPNVEYTWFYDEELVGEGASLKVGDIGEYVLVATDGINCDSELTISVNQSGIDYSGVDFLLPAEGLMNTPIASVDVSFPAVDSSMYIYEEDKVQILQVFENRTVFQFAEAGEYTIDWIANKEGCGKKFSKTIKIVETVEELENPELYQAFAGSLIDLGLYPNPNSGVFKAVISTSGIMDIDVSIYDMNGNVILSESYADETLYDLEFDISEMPAGPYSFFVSGGVDWKYVGFIKD